MNVDKQNVENLGNVTVDRLFQKQVNQYHKIF